MRIKFTTKFGFHSITLVSAIFALVLAYMPAHALPAAKLEVEELGQIQNGTIIIPLHVRFAEYPYCESVIRYTQGNAAVTLQPDNISIIDNTLPITPMAVSQPNADGWQTVRWATKSKGYSSTKIMASALNLIVSYNGDVISAEIITPDTSNSRIHLYCYHYSQTENVDFYNIGKVSPGTTSNTMLHMEAYSCAYRPDGTIIPTVLDSISIDNPDFRVTWSDSTEIKAPRSMRFVMDYPLLIWYTARNKETSRAMLHVYYAGGRREDVQIVANYDPKPKTNIKLLTPKDGDHISPCNKLKIQWTGYDTSRAIFVEATYNNGESWDTIRIIRNDSIYYWKVPSVITNAAKIRVRQITENTSNVYLNLRDTGITKVAFSPDSRYLLTASDNGIIFEWDLTNYSRIFQYKILPKATPTPSIVAKAVGYLDGTDRLYVLYSTLPIKPSTTDRLMFYSRNNATANRTINISPGFQVKNVCVSEKNKFMLLVPTVGSFVKVYSTVDGSYIKDLQFQYAITSFGINEATDCAIVTYVNGRTQVLSMPDFKAEDEVDMSWISLPCITKMSKDGKFLAFGTQKTTSNTMVSAQTSAYIFDIQQKVFYRKFSGYNTEFFSLDFNEISTRVLIGTSDALSIDFYKLISVDNFLKPDGTLTDFIYAPDGKTIATSTVDGEVAIAVSRILLGEVSEMEGNFSIEKPIITTEQFKFEPKFIDTENPMTIETSVCNKGNVPIVLKSSSFVLAKNFHLAKAIENDTVYPGTCFPITVLFTPADTGFVSDTLQIESCPSDYTIIVSGNGLPRNISFLSPNNDFGRVCVGESDDSTFVYIKNEDPVPLRVNYILIEDAFTNNISVISTFRDTIIPAGGTLAVRFRFAPTDSNQIHAKAYVVHSNQTVLVPYGIISGKGITTYIEISLPDIRFIPEIDTRTIKLRNPNDVTIHIEKYDYSGSTAIQILTPAGFDMAPGAEKELEVKSLALGSTDLQITLSGTPCGAICRFNAGKYSGASEIQAQDVSADPKEFATIPIYFDTKENKPYLGERFFEATVTVNPRMFLPLEIRSKYGRGTLVKNEIIADRRYITFRIDGDFPPSGVVAELYGVAGLCESDTSIVEFVSDAKYWGESVTVNARAGVFSLKNICNGRRVLQNNIQSVSAYPVPASETVFLAFDATEATEIGIELYNSLGMPACETIQSVALAGANRIPIDVSNLESGVYQGFIRSGNDRIQFRLVVAVR